MHFPLVYDVGVEAYHCNENNSYIFLPADFKDISLFTQQQIPDQNQVVASQSCFVLEQGARSKEQGWATIACPLTSRFISKRLTLAASARVYRHLPGRRRMRRRGLRGWLLCHPRCRCSQLRAAPGLWVPQCLLLNIQGVRPWPPQPALSFCTPQSDLSIVLIDIHDGYIISYPFTSIVQSNRSKLAWFLNLSITHLKEGSSYHQELSATVGNC